jgi:hypothetical protein
MAELRRRHTNAASSVDAPTAALEQAQPSVNGDLIHSELFKLTSEVCAHGSVRRANCQSRVVAPIFCGLITTVKYLSHPTEKETKGKPPPLPVQSAPHRTSPHLTKPNQSASPHDRHLDLNPENGPLSPPTRILARHHPQPRASSLRTLPPAQAPVRPVPALRRLHPTKRRLWMYLPAFRTR